MFLRNRCTIIALILLLLLRLEAKEYEEKFKKSHKHKNLAKVNVSAISTSENIRLKKMHDNEIKKLIAGSAKFIRPRPSSGKSRVSGSSTLNADDRARESIFSPDTSVHRSTGQINNLRRKYEKKKQAKLLNIRKSQQRNMNNRKNKVSPIRSCSSGIKGNRGSHACHKPERKVKRGSNTPTGTEVTQPWNNTCIVPIVAWLWPGIWSYFG